jgi:ATP-binding cassette subfamily C protein
VGSLEALIAAPGGLPVVARLLEGWVQLLWGALPGAPVPTRCRAVRPGEAIDVAGREPLRALAGMCWIAPARPPAAYAGLGVSEAALAVPVLAWPLGETTWALAPEGSLRIWSTPELLGAAASVGFAQGFAAFVVTLAARRRAELARQRLERDRASQESEGGHLSRSLGKLARVGRAERLTRALAADGGDTTRALGAIAEALGTRPPAPDAELASPAGDVGGLMRLEAALNRASGARSRPVLLERDWWRSDAGPLLGFVPAEAPPIPGAARRADAGDAAGAAGIDGAGDDVTLRPVALLPDRGRYRLYDPQGGPPRQVDRAVAETLDPRAHQFYRPLPAGPPGPLDLVRFAGAGAGRDGLVVAGLGLLLGLLGLLIPLVTGVIFDRIVPGAERSLLLQLVLVLGAIFLGASLFELGQGLARVRVETRLDAGMEAAVWDRLLRLPLAFFRNYATGDLAARAAGVGAIREAVAGATLASLLGGVFSLWNLALLFVLDVRLALLALGLVLLAALVAGVASVHELRERRALLAVDGALAGLLLQILGGVAKLRVARAARRAFGVWADLYARRGHHEVALARGVTRLGVFQSVFPVLCAGALFQVLASGVAPGQAHGAGLSTGSFLAFWAAFSSLLRASLEMLSAVLRVVAVIPLYERARPILRQATEGEGAEGARTTLEGGVELSHVTFRYREEGPPVLDDVNLRILPGEFVAIVGPSGSGKSTLLRLLLGFEAPTSGGVYYDGQSLGSLDLRAARQQIGVVLQSSDLMAGDIFTNIVGSSGRGVEDAWHAARQAAFDKDIEAMPMGMHTVLQQGRSTLSGGQRQRLLIARALIARPRLLFFDEATSALDNQTQAVVSASLDALRVTRVVIAHRLSTIRHADRIVVLDRGRIVESGRLDELMALQGAFAALARRQMI